MNYIKNKFETREYYLTEILSTGCREGADDIAMTF